MNRIPNPLTQPQGNSRMTRVHHLWSQNQRMTRTPQRSICITSWAASTLIKTRLYDKNKKNGSRQEKLSLRSRSWRDNKRKSRLVRQLVLSVKEKKLSGSSQKEKQRRSVSNMKDNRRCWKMKEESKPASSMKDRKRRCAWNICARRPLGRANAQHKRSMRLLRRRRLKKRLSKSIRGLWPSSSNKKDKKLSAKKPTREPWWSFWGLRYFSTTAR